MPEVYIDNTLSDQQANSRECATSTLPTPFHVTEVPPNATYYGTYFFGSSYN